MDKLPELPPELSEDGGKKLTEAEIQELLRPSLRNWRRRKAARAALSLAGASRAIAQTELRRESAKAVQESWPRDSYHLEQVLWPSLSKYSETVFDEIAEVRLAELGSKFLVRRYTHWLKCTGVSAVVDEDVCLLMGEGQFYVTVQHVIGVIGDSKWPRQIEETKRALFGMLTELVGGHHTENLEKRLRVHLNGLIARWEGEAIRQTSSPPASETNAVVTPIAANAVEIAIRRPGDTAPETVETASVHPQPATTPSSTGQGRKRRPKPDYETAARVAAAATPKQRVPTKRSRRRRVRGSARRGKKERATSSMPVPQPVQRKRGRPQTIPDARKVAAAKLKATGGTNKEAAALLYDTKYPSDQQRRNVPGILRHFQQKMKRPSSTVSPPNASPKPRKNRG